MQQICVNLIELRRACFREPTTMMTGISWFVSSVLSDASPLSVSLSGSSSSGICCADTLTTSSSVMTPSVARLRGGLILRCLNSSRAVSPMMDSARSGSPTPGSWISSLSSPRIWMIGSPKPGGVYTPLDDAFKAFHVIGVGRLRFAAVFRDRFGAIDQVAAALQVEPKTQPEECIAASLKAAKIDSLETEQQPGAHNQQQNRNQRSCVPTHRYLHAQGWHVPAQEPAL